MSEEERPGIGAALRHAREAKGWTTQDVGNHLRLMARQVEAIEEEEFAKLGPAVFARGFVRNYAKLVGLDPDELLDQMTLVKTTPVQETKKAPYDPRQELWKSPLVWAGVGILFLLLAIPVGLYLWLSGDGEEVAAPVAEQTMQPPPPPPAPQIDAQSPQQQPVPEPGPAAPQTATPALPQAGTSTPAAPVFRPPLPFPAPPAAAPVQKPAPAAVPQPAPAPAPAESPAAAKTGSGPHLKFEQSAWVQIRDSSGRIVHSGLNPAGSSVEVSGKAPFFLVVGNAEHVNLTYKGQAIDLKPFTAVNVARLTLN